jgi:DUF4097 and DUF4098 domain-containing protein YvlB
MSSPVALPVPGTADLHLHLTSGSVRVNAEDRDDVKIERGAPSSDRIEIEPTGRIRLKSAKGGSANLEISCPIGSDVYIGAISGAVELTGQFGAVRVNAVSGNVKVDRAESLDVRCVSGSIEVGACSGECRLQTKSGTTSIRSAGDTLASTISGRIQLEQATGNVKMRTVSGSIDVGLEGKGDVKVETMSGSVRVEVAAGVRPSTKLKSLTGRPKSTCEEGNDCRITVHSLSGRIEVVPG